MLPIIEIWSFPFINITPDYFLTSLSDRCVSCKLMVGLTENALVLAATNGIRFEDFNNILPELGDKSVLPCSP